MIADLIREFQPQASVRVYRGVLYVDGDPIGKRRRR
jgi:hypothetical protein